jgi:NADPH2:quinone reductase
MKAAVYYHNGPPSVFKYEDVPDPRAGAGEIVLRVQAVSIEGGDLINRSVSKPQVAPHIVGYQAAGTVTEIGEGVERFKLGQRVVAFMWSGSHASMAKTAARYAFAVPDGMDLMTASVVPVAYGTAHDCLFEFGHLKRGETVLVQGAAGGVGLATVQLAKRAGARVFGTASSDDRLERLKAHGLDQGFNYRVDAVTAAVMAATGDRGVDLVVDPIAGKVLEQSLACVGHRGRITLVGGAGRDQFTPALWPLMFKEASITGVFLGAEFDRQPERTRAMIEQLIADCAAGTLKPVIDRVFPLAQAATAHEYIESRRAFGRVVLVPEGSGI